MTMAATLSVNETLYGDTTPVQKKPLKKAMREAWRRHSPANTLHAAWQSVKADPYKIAVGSGTGMISKILTSSTMHGAASAAAAKLAGMAALGSSSAALTPVFATAAAGVSTAAIASLSKEVALESLRYYRARKEDRLSARFNWQAVRENTWGSFKQSFGIGTRIFTFIQLLFGIEDSFAAGASQEIPCADKGDQGFTCPAPRNWTGPTRPFSEIPFKDEAPVPEMQSESTAGQPEVPLTVEAKVEALSASLDRSALDPKTLETLRYAEKGQLWAIKDMAHIMANTMKDYEAAAKWAAISAEQGHVPSVNFLKQLRGMGVIPDEIAQAPTPLQPQTIQEAVPSPALEEKPAIAEKAPPRAAAFCRLSDVYQKSVNIACRFKSLMMQPGEVINVVFPGQTPGLFEKAVINLSTDSKAVPTAGLTKEIVRDLINAVRSEAPSVRVALAPEV